MNVKTVLFILATTALISHSTQSLGNDGSSEGNALSEPEFHSEVHSGLNYRIPVPVLNEPGINPRLAQKMQTVVTGSYGPVITGSRPSGNTVVTGTYGPSFSVLSPAELQYVVSGVYGPGFTGYSPVHTGFAAVPGVHDSSTISPKPTGGDYALHGNAYDFVNVYYIVPSDLEPYSGWQEKMSNVLLEVQEGFAYRMKKSKFLNSQKQGLTFGLLVNKEGLVKMKYIKSRKTSSELGDVSLSTMNAAAATIRKIGDEYDQLNPEEVKGTTSIYIIRNKEGDGGQLKDQPHGAFMGLYWDARQHGYGYFVDSESAYRNFKGTLEQGKHWVFHTVMKSGLVHELGHAFGLDHHCRVASDPMSVSIMSWANGVDFDTTNDETLDFSLASKESLALTQAFRQSSPKKESQLAVASSDLKCDSLSEDYIHCKITYVSPTVPIALAKVYLDPKIDAWDYNAMVFYQKNIGPSEIDIVIPVSDLKHKKPDSRMAVIPETGSQKWGGRFVLIAKNGTRFSSKKDVIKFDFVNGIPVFNPVHDEL